VTAPAKRDKLSLDVLLGAAHTQLRKQAKQELRKLRKNAAALRQRRAAHLRQLEQEIHARWGPAIELYETLIVAVLELGHDVARSRGPSATRVGKKVLFKVLVTLHGRACLVASDVITLIRTGHGAAAYARFRTLHDIAVVAAFLTRYGEEAAVRFYEHAEIENLKTAKVHREIYGPDAYVTDAMLAEMEQRRTELLAQYGKPFGSDNGWAASFIGNKSPKLKHIEEHAKLEKARLHYRGASSAVHSNSAGALLGLRQREGELVVLSVPSDDGLGTPGFSSLIPLMLVTSNLVACTNNRDDKVRLFALGELMQEAIEAFIERMAET
jgi:hypothetical protein